MGIKVTNGQKDWNKCSLRNVNMSVKEILMKDQQFGLTY